MKQGSPPHLTNSTTSGTYFWFSDVSPSLAEPLRTLYTTWHPRGGNDTCTRLLKRLGIRIMASGSRLCKLCVVCSVLITFETSFGFTKDNIFFIHSGQVRCQRGDSSNFSL